MPALMNDQPASHGLDIAHIRVNAWHRVKIGNAISQSPGFNDEILSTRSRAYGQVDAQPNTRPLPSSNGGQTDEEKLIFEEPLQAIL